MKKAMNRLLDVAIQIPNWPFSIVLGIFLVLMILRHTSLTEIMLRKNEELWTPEIEEFAKKVYPEWLESLIAIFFYVGLTSYFIINYWK